MQRATPQTFITSDRLDNIARVILKDVLEIAFYSLQFETGYTLSFEDVNTVLKVYSGLCWKAQFIVFKLLCFY